MAGIAIVNTLTFPRLKPVNFQQNFNLPHVSVLIPARNEATVIGPTVKSWLNQTYPNFELIILDDHSTDGTARIAQAEAQQDSRVQVITGQTLPAGWLGKNWACHQLAQAATGEWLIFADADVRWSPEALAALVVEMERTQADLLTIWPTQHTHTWGERLVVPLMALVILAYLPLPLVHHTPWPAFAAANGQCLAFRRRAYQTIGGHAALRDNVLEDVNFARRIKAQGLRLRMADGAGLVSCRMYPDWPAVRDGFAKNILAGYGHSVFFLVLAAVFHWLVFLLPWLLLFTISPLCAPSADLRFTIDTSPFAIHTARALCAPLASLWDYSPFTIHNLLFSLLGLGICLRMLTAAVTHQRLGDALLMPISVLLMTRIAVQSIWWQWRYGGPRWKGRVVKRSNV
jgi:chlorobactene glucosyltransferase